MLKKDREDIPNTKKTTFMVEAGWLRGNIVHGQCDGSQSNLSFICEDDKYLIIFTLMMGS